jgi:anti-anti-sigma factor
MNQGEGGIMLKVRTTKFGNVAVVCVEGRMVSGSTDPLRAAVLAQGDASAIVVDLANVSLIDAGGLGVMLELRENTESKGIEFRLNNVTKLVRRILEITRLDSVFKIADNQHVGAERHRPELSELACCA